MQRIMLKSKIHNARVTKAELEYCGSITIDREIIEQADILPNERVQIVNLDSGSRIETYVIEGKSGTRDIFLNGPAALTGKAGDRIHIISYIIMDEDECRSFKPTLIFLDENNKKQENKWDIPGGTISQ